MRDASPMWVALSTIAKLAKGCPPVAHEVLKGEGESVIIMLYPSHQILVHLLHDRTLRGEGSRVAKYWMRRRRPHEVPVLIDTMRHWLARRAADRKRQYTLVANVA